MLLQESGIGQAASALPVVLRLGPQPSRRHIEDALNTILQRHTAFTASFLPSAHISQADRRVQISSFIRSRVFTPGLYAQTIEQSTRITIRERKLRQKDQSDGIEQIVQEELSRPLNLSTPPSIRATLISLNSDERVLLLILSHMSVDGWSMGVLLNELSQARLERIPASQFPFSGQHYDFARQQHEEVQSGLLARDEEYWAQQWADLQGAKICFSDLPFARATPWNRTAAFSSTRCTFDVLASHEIRRFAAGLGVTPYIFFRTIFTIVLHHYTGKTRLAFWANLANRRRSEFRATVGWCANQHLVTVVVTPGLSSGDLCHVVARAIYGASAHERLPLPALWHRLGENLDHHDTQIVFDLLPAVRLRHGGSWPELDGRLTVLRGADLSVRLQQVDSAFALSAAFNSLRYCSSGIESMLESMHRIALTVMKDSKLSVSDCAAMITQ